MNVEEAQKYAQRRLVELASSGNTKVESVNQIIEELWTQENFVTTMYGYPVRGVSLSEDGMIEYYV